MNYDHGVVVVGDSFLHSLAVCDDDKRGQLCCIVECPQALYHVDNRFTPPLKTVHYNFDVISVFGLVSIQFR